MLQSMTTFVIAALILIIMPGPDQALITRNALIGGRRGGLLTVTGGVLGLTLHASAAALGLSALLLASATAFTALKIAGAVYLLWLGVHMLRSALCRRRQPATGHPAADALPATPKRRWVYLRQGLLSNALNPKVALFFVALLPQFLSTGSGAPRAEALLLSATFAGLYLAWFGLYVAGVDRLGRWLRRPRVQAWIERITGVVLITVAVRLATATT